MNDFESLAHVRWECKYHVIFIPKYRRKVTVSDLNLKGLKMEVSYSPHDFQSEDGTYWLPSAAVVEIRTKRQRWRNLHHYSAYKRFSVNTEDKISR